MFTNITSQFTEHTFFLANGPKYQSIIHSDMSHTQLVMVKMNYIDMAMGTIVLTM